MNQASGEPPEFDDATRKRLKREAMSVVVQLPEDRAEAVAILDMAYSLVVGFVNSPATETPPAPWRPKRSV